MDVSIDEDMKVNARAHVEIVAIPYNQTQLGNMILLVHVCLIPVPFGLT